MQFALLTAVSLLTLAIAAPVPSIDVRYVKHLEALVARHEKSCNDNVSSDINVSPDITLPDITLPEDVCIGIAVCNPVNVGGTQNNKN